MTPHLYIKYDEKPPGVHKAYIRESPPGRGGGAEKHVADYESRCLRKRNEQVYDDFTPRRIGYKLD